MRKRGEGEGAIYTRGEARGGKKRPVRLRHGVGPSGERLSRSPSPPRNSAEKAAEISRRVTPSAPLRLVAVSGFDGRVDAVTEMLQSCMAI